MMHLTKLSALLFASLGSAEFVTEQYNLGCAGTWALTGASSVTGNTELAKAFDGLPIRIQITPTDFTTGLQQNVLLTMVLGDAFTMTARVYNDCSGEIVPQGPPMLTYHAPGRDAMIALADQYLYTFLHDLSSWRMSTIGSRPVLTLHATSNKLPRVVDLALQFTQM
eukprot:Protomagalhaensia_wolfi_Nauph_80__1211@NODE_1714_length_1384_cov_199_748699_g1330_i0_p1_GENE_NODE_1714_length_1384_cov_199_748699_g1330_i0NODE_1714_length_1384_cov_199_748699_g1330_i0_p1_ORF_typecomplete_len167_score20_06PATR/PF12951_7/0_027_NODE_1714_length_1384_cov_199_748699_g1330_i08181318